MARMLSLPASLSRVVMGGDPYFYYTGTYSCKDGRINGELVTKQHAPYHGPAQFSTRVAKSRLLGDV